MNALFDADGLKILVVAAVVAMCFGFVVSTRRRAKLARQKIAGPEDAQRLAHAIVADIALYNPGIFAGDGAVDVDVVAEGRALFAARVPVELQHHYDDAIAEARGTRS